MTVQHAIDAIASRRPVVAVGREGEGALVFAAARATPELVAFTVRHTSGFLCVALPGPTCDRLHLPPMLGGRDRFGPAYRVTVDACGTGTGISARDRALTIAASASPGAGGGRVRAAGSRGAGARPGRGSAAPGRGFLNSRSIWPAPLSLAPPAPGRPSFRGSARSTPPVEPSLAAGHAQFARLRSSAR
ncbi:3,4-dihydroxy-2-butanone-4-phosphate synthase [Amycolatopsis pithecellobii]|uniref:3,4-dihydroxy-2-butanone-4-phosphate synthase n=1 Tax=Amycolatopsis pithecellobii TaxID=664692 RepID=UPI001FE2D7D1|nr:3,4-dihydroxy-2-butanone-4-phosphate synthase [Amycolatopsis pithecellobii]